MNPLRISLAVSLLLNAALAAAWLRPPSGVERIPPAAAATATRRAPAAAATPLWSRLDAHDDTATASRLADLGLSPAEVRRVMLMRIDERARPAFAPEPTSYWRTPFGVSFDARKRAENLRLMAELDAQRRALGATDLTDDPVALDRARKQYGPLSAEKLQALAVIEADYREMYLRQAATLAERRAAGAPDDRQQVDETLQAGWQADIRALLTPGEFAEFELRASRSADRLRTQLEAFRPDEAEYRAIFELQRPFAGQLANPALTPAERKALTDQMNAQVAATLGPERAADYLEVSTHAVDQTARLLARLELPARTYGTIRDIRQDLTQRAAALQSDASLPAAERTARLAALAAEARTRLTATLGERGFAAYDDLKGEWIQALVGSPPGGP